MKIVFIPQSCIPFHGRTVEERPLGGIETAVIRLAAALDALGQEVKVLTPIDNPPLHSPLYLPYRAIQDLGRCDAVIAVRDWQPALLNVATRCRLFWTGDSFDQPQSVGIGDRRVIKALDRLCPVSEWHADTLCRSSGYPRERCYVLRNGVHLDYFTGTETRRRKRLIYSSTPYRGLKYVPEIYRELLKRHADLELHIFSGYGVYAGTTTPPSALAEYEALKQELQSLPGCVVHGNVKQSELAREFMRSSILLYPNTFEETSCITAMEAQAAGCAVVTSDLGALRETIGSAGFLIRGMPPDTRYMHDFIAATDKLLSDDQCFAAASSAGLEKRSQLSWSTVAQSFLSYLQSNALT